MAAGALAVLQENGIQSPQKMSLVGFDDGLIARYTTPGLTTVRYPIQMMAEKAANLALALADEQDVDNEAMRFSPTLVRRGSVDRLTSE